MNCDQREWEEGKMPSLQCKEQECALVQFLIVCQLELVSPHLVWLQFMNCKYVSGNMWLSSGEDLPDLLEVGEWEVSPQCQVVQVPIRQVRLVVVQ